ncbi:type I phosphomannose isomerase catalytic subunit [Tenacibaculum sp. IB213877]|uniref:type I phosphomannose isomerase catalytic subunit n=1 Tax=Tenacibaculum sp. IB213877 TaxID=3097351 RepID=UPI002A5A78F8|nr:type I phosphomannose isomerase catalytic subunit [Tenacibaculum sp. IB213877]MDY0781649.1 type I phosphomannose isomerase catalytic subunit [Tenacibaculum sp. IB213877]
MAKINQFIKFEPILKDKIWGGEKLMKLLNKKSDRKDIGESWEISDVEGDTSVVSNGSLKGKDLKELLSIYKADLVGEKIYDQFGDKFPLLIKFIDAKEALSIQLHPHDELAKKRHNSFGKTEMWYVMQADKNANLIVGFQKDSDQKEYIHHLNNKSLLDILNVDLVNKGDVYFIPTGRVHAIGAGVLLAEIQQTSDITYRVYDWDRQDSEGNYRELHTDLAIDAIDYKAQESYKTAYTKQENTSSPIVSCPYFTTNILPVLGKIEVNHSDKDSFVIYMCVEGEAEFEYQGQKEKLQMGQTLLVPACIKKISIASKEKTELLEVFIP